MLSSQLAIPSPSVSALGSSPLAPYINSQMSLIPLPLRSRNWAWRRPAANKPRNSAARSGQRPIGFIRQLHIRVVSAASVPREFSPVPENRRWSPSISSGRRANFQPPVLLDPGTLFPSPSKDLPSSFFPNSTDLARQSFSKGACEPKSPQPRLQIIFFLK